jgi:opacity protein-like surface antigen
MKGRVLKRHLLASVGLVALTTGVASPASAAPPPPPAPMFSWSGFYIGAHAGYGWGRDPFTDAIFSGKAPPLTDTSSNGFLGGFQAGANWQTGSWVGGVEIDLSATSIKGSSPTVTGTTVGTGAPPLVATLSASQADKFDWLGSGRARLGYLAWPNVLLYGTAGPAWTRLVQTQTAVELLSEAGVGSETITETSAVPSWRFGAVAGVGAEARLWDSNWLARLEYLHYDFGKSSGFISSSTDFEISGRRTADIVRAGLSYQFGQDPGSASYASATKMAMPVKAARAAPWTWSGFYIGGHAGYGWGRDPFTDPFSSSITITGIDSNGFVGGIQAGANRQMGAWVGGFELDLSGSGIKGSTSVTVPLTGGATGTETVKESDSFELLGSARARIGYLAWPDVLFYGTGGPAWTRMVQSRDDTTIVTSGGTSGASSNVAVNWEFGWVAGIGVEARLWNTNWLGRIEYLHYDFGDSGSSFDSGGVTFSSGHLTTDVVRAGLSYKFDWSAPAAGPARIAMPVKAMPVKALPVMASNWSGFYVGGHAGYGWGRDPISESTSATGSLGGLFGSDPLFRTGINSNGYVAGFQAGANLQMGAFVSGLEIDLSATGIKGSTTNIDADGDESETHTDRFDMLGSARARFGYLALPNVLFYGTGGLAWTRLSQPSLDVTTTGVSGSTLPVWEFGWVAGAGAETILWNSNWLLRVEYLHYDFGDQASVVENEVASTTFGSGTASGSDSFGHLTTDVVRTALSFKFN